MARNPKESDGVSLFGQTPSAQGNIWGWKFSLMSLGFILFMVGFAAIRFWMLPEDKRTLAPLPEETAQDSLSETR